MTIQSYNIRFSPKNMFSFFRSHIGEQNAHCIGCCISRRFYQVLVFVAVPEKRRTITKIPGRYLEWNLETRDVLAQDVNDSKKIVLTFRFCALLIQFFLLIPNMVYENHRMHFNRLYDRKMVSVHHTIIRVLKLARRQLKNEFKFSSHQHFWCLYA